jgi:hypothetical protein
MNTTTLTTVLGLGQAVGAAIIDFFAHTSMDGGAMKQPTFWIGLIVASLMGVKAYYTQGTAPATDAPKV